MIYLILENPGNPGNLCSIQHMSLILIAAISKNNCIGKNGNVPWHIPEDLEHFKHATIGKTVLMGRKTWESIPLKYRPLPNRKNIVITRQSPYLVPEGVETYATVDEALAAHANEDIMVVGGGEIYAQTIDRADVLDITHVDQNVDGDAFFPEINPMVWKDKKREQREGYAFVTYARN